MPERFISTNVENIMFWSFCLSRNTSSWNKVGETLRGRKHARQVPPRNCGIAISRKARARQNARPPPRPPTPLRLRHRRAEPREIHISKDNRSPTRSAVHRWPASCVIGFLFKPPPKETEFPFSSAFLLLRVRD